MDEWVCLQCGKELEQDWAPCPHCGWKAPESWEEAEEESPSSKNALLAKPHRWIKWTTWLLIGMALLGLLIYF